jgi:PBP1b-binding outer membrane lipoprotein LpoB
MKFIKLVIISFFSVLILSGCSSKLFTKTVYVVPELPSNIFTSCEKPTTVLSDLKVSNIKTNKDLNWNDVEVITGYTRQNIDHAFKNGTQRTIDKVLEMLESV